MQRIVTGVARGVNHWSFTGLTALGWRWQM
jgi:hypothetical protein